MDYICIILVLPIALCGYGTLSFTVRRPGVKIQVLTECDTSLLGEWFRLFERFVVPSSSRRPSVFGK